MSDRWIVGIDGSSGSRSALGWAIRHAPSRCAGTTAVLAYQQPTMAKVLSAAHLGHDDEPTAAGVAMEELDATIADLVTDRPIERLTVEGPPGKALVEATSDADLLVVGRQGNGGNWRQVLGSVSRYCVMHCTIPTVVVPNDWDGSDTTQIVVGFDGSDNACAALAWAVAFADAETTVRALIVLNIAPWLGTDVIEARLADQLRTEEQRLRQLIDAADPRRVAEREVVVGDARVALARAATTAELLVVGAHGAGRLSAALLGSVSTWLLDATDQPIVVVPPPDDR